MYIRYEDAKKLRDRIKTMHDLGYTESHMAEVLEVSRPRVAYHLRKLGLTKLNSKHNFRLCSACNKRPIEFSYICRNNECFDIFLDALHRCQMPRDDADRLLINTIMPSTDVRIPDTAVICRSAGVLRVFRDEVDHIRYHAYSRKKLRHPPTILWTDLESLKAFKRRKLEESYIRRNLLSESPQPYRPRE